MSRLTSLRAWPTVAFAAFVAVGAPSLAAQRTARSKGVPAAPTNVAAAGGRFGVTVTWSGVPTQAMYRVLRSVDLAKPGIDLTPPIAVTSYLDRTADPGGTYYYQIIAVYPDQSEGPGTPTSLTPAQNVGQPIKPGGAATLSGLMLPLLAPPARASGQIVAVPMASVILTVGTLCNPGKKLPGPGPASFAQLSFSQPSAGLVWPGVAGAVAYVAERSIDGSNIWTPVGSTCGGPSPIRTHSVGPAATEVLFIDHTGGFVPGTQYVYKITAIGAAGETGWNSTRWKAPPLLPPTWLPPTITGSTVVLRWTFVNTTGNANRDPDQYRVSNASGWSQTLACATCQLMVYGVPEGTNTFTLTAQWVDNWSAAPKPVLVATSATTTVTIKP